MSDAEKIAAFFKQHEKWSAQLVAIRKALAETELSESVKWGSPSYSIDSTVLISLVAFKKHCAVWFHQGVFLEDKSKILINAQEDTTKGLRQLRIESGETIKPALIKAYAVQTIKNHRAGKRVASAKKVLKVPAELEAALKKNAKLKTAFAALTPGRQREYADHIAAAKQEKTRLARVEKAEPLMLKGVGLNDRYKNC